MTADRIEVYDLIHIPKGLGVETLQFKLIRAMTDLKAAALNLLDLLSIEDILPCRKNPTGYHRHSICQ
jgi:hypothetical protein